MNRQQLQVGLSELLDNSEVAAFRSGSPVLNKPITCGNECEQPDAPNPAIPYQTDSKTASNIPRTTHYIVCLKNSESQPTATLTVTCSWPFPSLPAAQPSIIWRLDNNRVLTFIFF